MNDGPGVEVVRQPELRHSNRRRGATFVRCDGEVHRRSVRLDFYGNGARRDRTQLRLQFLMVESVNLDPTVMNPVRQVPSASDENRPAAKRARAVLIRRFRFRVGGEDRLGQVPQGPKGRFRLESVQQGSVRQPALVRDSVVAEMPVFVADAHRRRAAAPLAAGPGGVKGFVVTSLAFSVRDAVDAVRPNPVHTVQLVVVGEIGVILLPGLTFLDVRVNHFLDAKPRTQAREQNVGVSNLGAPDDTDERDVRFAPVEEQARVFAAVVRRVVPNVEARGVADGLEIGIEEPAIQVRSLPTVAEAQDVSAEPFEW